MEINLEVDKSVLLSHPSYPEKYGPNLDCGYSIKVSGNFSIGVHILEFLLPDTASCGGDSLSFYDGVDMRSKKIGHFCRLPTLVPLVVYSTGPEIFIRFKSDRDFSGNYLLMVRAAEQRFEDSDCFTAGHLYTGSLSQGKTGICENWPVPSFFQFPVIG